MNSYPQPAEIAVFAVWIVYGMWMSYRMEKSTVSPLTDSEGMEEMDRWN